MSKRKTSTKDTIFHIIKNQLRGAIGSGSRKTIELIDSLRSSLPASFYSPLFLWLAGYAQQKHHLFAPVKVNSYKELKVRPVISAGNLELDILWWAYFLSGYITQINLHLEYRSAISKLVAIGDYKAALAMLDNVETELGKSLWLIETRIALLQEEGGLDTQKSYQASILGVAKGSIASYIAYQASNRNSESIPAEVFLERANHGIQEMEVLNEDYKDYLAFRVTRTLPETFDGLSKVLNIEASTSIYDLYETFILILEVITVHEKGRELFGAVQRALNIIDGISDPAHKKIRLLTGHSLTELDLQVEFDSYLEQAVLDSDDTEIFRCLASQPAQSMGSIKSAAHYLYLNGVGFDEASNLQEEVVRSLIKIYAFSDDVLSSISRIMKIMMNFHGVDIGRNLRHCFIQPENILLIGSRYSIYESRALHPADWLYLDEIHPDTFVDYVRSTHGDYPAEFTTLDPENPFNYISEIRRTALVEGIDQAILKALHSLHLHEGKESWFQLKRIGGLLDLKRGDVDSAISCFGVLVCAREAAKYLLPINSVVRYKDWDFWEKRYKNISTSIILSVYLSLYEDEEQRNNLRDVYDEYMEGSGYILPHNMEDSIDKFDKDELVYFLREICVAPVMDVSIYLASTRELQDERIRVCSMLARIDPDNREEYRDEVTAITASININQGMNDLDKSRIYVDAAPLKQKAKRRYGELFDTYKLVMDDLADDEFSEVVMDLLFGEKKIPKEYLELPSSEATEIMVDILRGIGDEFLNNSEYGLDSYLSMRIRHGTLYGTLSSPFKTAGILLNKKSSGEYEPGSIFLDFLRGVPEGKQKVLIAGFAEFTEQFNILVDYLKNERLQIKSIEKPCGVFEINLTTVYVRSVATNINIDTTFDDFFELCIATYWSVMQAPLLEVQAEISGYIIDEIGNYIEKLKTDVNRLISNNDKRRIAFLSVISDSFLHFQREAERVSLWFSLPEKEVGESMYEFDHIVDISVETIKNIHPGFDPKIERNIEISVPVFVGSLSTITDILLIMLDNAHKHSGLTSPQLGIFVKECETGKHLSISVVCQLLSNPDDGVIADLRKLKSRVESSESVEKVKKEGRSGMYKLSRTASSGYPNALDFSFSDEKKFITTVVIDFEIKSYPNSFSSKAIEQVAV